MMVGKITWRLIPLSASLGYSRIILWVKGKSIHPEHLRGCNVKLKFRK